MSYIALINGHQLELSDSSPIAYTKQVNDLARLDNRQSNFTHKFIVPFTATNKRAMEFVYGVGNQSNIPYQKNAFDLIDADSGQYLIYRGWANINQTSQKGYEINVYDGYIDFYRRIENCTLTDVGISGLNHAKNLANVIQSWDNTYPYMYAISDYNGKNSYTTPILTSAAILIGVNIDYQVPSARVSYLWQRIFDFAQFTYSGSYFGTDKFLNLFMTFPKPVPTAIPITENITIQQSTITTRWEEQFDHSYIIFFDVHFLPTNVTSAYFSSNAASLCSFTTSGSYRINCSGFFLCSYLGGPITRSGIITWTVYGPGPMTSLNTTTGTINADNNESVIIAINAGQKLFFTAPLHANEGSVITTIDLVTGYNANFEEALVDFKATDFINEIIQQAGLTAFKDQYRNHIEFLTMDELLRSPDVLNWSDKFQFKDGEKYKIGRYAKKNNFKYRYNSENEIYNNGAIYIDDQNLSDETDVINSKFYTPERATTNMVGRSVNTFKTWEKELNDNGTIKYKDLTGRYYFLRVSSVATAVTLGSETLNTHQDVTSLMMANYEGLKFSEIINTNYVAIQSIIDKAKAIDAYFYFKKSTDVYNFDFKKLIYIEQLASYYLVNKIPNFIKGKVTKCELIEVDYQKTLPVPPTPHLSISNPQIASCILTFDVDTNIEQPAMVMITATSTAFVVPPATPPTYSVWASMDSNQVSFSLSDFPASIYNYDFTVQWGVLVSNAIPIAIDGTCYKPSSPNLSVLTITSLETISVGTFMRTIRVNYTSDLSVSTMPLRCVASVALGGDFPFDFYTATQNGYIEIEVAHNGLGGPANWAITLSALGVTSNTEHSTS
jgi:hypothetical protein